MSSWNFNSWNVKDSFTYKTSQKAKKIIEQTVKKDSKNVNRVFKDAFSGDGKGTTQQYDNDYTEQARKDSHSYNYNYDMHYDNPSVTPPQSTTRNVGGVEQKQKKKKREKKKETVIDENTIIVYKKSAIPFYAVAVFWVIVAFFFGIYELIDLVAVTLTSVLIFFICSKIFKGKKTYVHKEPEIKVTGDEKTDKILINGREFIKKMKKAQVDIDNTEIELEVWKLEQVCTKIVNFIEKHPEKAPSVRKFMNYYVPTTLKLLECYDTLEEQRVEGQNITSSMKSIEEAMRKIVVAFERQLDSLFADEAMDISTDISVLENMLSQEGFID